ncbi:MAG TPA: DNA polymerase III subunit delta [Candidatus Pacearchaeota archaeon]|nr:DNA polymerase III subunit delta [Candidatus Pacearchaeota archaeon]
MISFICGPDSFRAHKKLREIIDQAKIDNLPIDFFDFSEKQWNYNDFKGEQNNFSLFEEKKAFIIRNLFSEGSLEFCEQFEVDFDKHIKSDDKIIFYDSIGLDSVPKKAGKSLLDSLASKSELFFFDLMNPAMVRNWIEKECQNQGKEIESMAREALFNYFGNDLWQLENEISKLSNYSKEKIVLADIKKICRPIENLDIFKTIEAIAKKEKPHALNLVYRHLRAGESPFYIISMLSDTFKKMIAVKELADSKCDYRNIAKITGYHPFVLSKIYAQAQEFDLQDLKKIYNKIFKADFDMKTGRVEPPVALDLLIINI